LKLQSYSTSQICFISLFLYFFIIRLYLLSLLMSAAAVVQCNIGGAVLYFCDAVGSGAVHALWYPVRRLCYLA